MKKKTVVVTAIFIVSTIIQLSSQVVVTRIFGASKTLDNFLAAVAIPTIIITVIYGTLSDLFIPFYSKEKITDEEKADAKLLWGIFCFTTVGLGAALVLSLLSPILIKCLYFSNVGLDLGEVSKQFSLMVYAIPFSIVATLFGTYFYAKKEYTKFPIAQAIGSVINLGLILIFHQFIGAWALVASFVLNILFQIPFVLPRINLKFEKFNSVPLFALWIPLLMANLFIRSDTIIIRSFGSTMGEGYLVYLNLVTKVFSLSTSLLTIGIQVMLLPNLVEALAGSDHKMAFDMVRKAKASAIILSIVGSLLVYFLSPFVLKLLFLGGKFSLFDLSKTSELLPYFIIPAIGWGIISVFFQPLIARKRYSELAFISCFSFVFGWCVASRFFMGPLSIAIALTILLFGGVIGSEIVWLLEKKRIKNG